MAACQYQKTAASDVAAQGAQFDSTASSSQLTMIMVGLVAIVLGSVAAFLLTRRSPSGSRRCDGGRCDRRWKSSAHRRQLQRRDRRPAAAFQRMIDYLNTMVAAAGRHAEGDLSAEVTPRSAQDALGNSFSAMIANLRELVGNLSQAAGSSDRPPAQMSTTSEEAGKATGEIARAIADVAEGAERQVNLVDGAKRPPSEVAAAVNESAEQAEQTAEAATRARKIAQQGVAAAEQANEAMGSVRDSSESGHARDPRARGQVTSRSARSSRRSPASPSRPTCSRSTPRSRPPAPASRAAASRSSPRRSGSWPRSPSTPHRRSRS